MSWFRAHPDWGLQDNGLTATQTLGSEWDGPPLAVEERDVTSDTGDCLCTDIAQGVGQLHARYLLLYRSDIDAPANQAYLHQAALDVGAGA
jgi:hypothetical protein